MSLSIRSGGKSERARKIEKGSIALGRFYTTYAMSCVAGWTTSYSTNVFYWTSVIRFATTAQFHCAPQLIFLCGWLNFHFSPSLEPSTDSFSCRINLVANFQFCSQSRSGLSQFRTSKWTWGLSIAKQNLPSSYVQWIGFQVFQLSFLLAVIVIS
jgi:hypothetical protein